MFSANFSILFLFEIFREYFGTEIRTYEWIQKFTIAKCQNDSVLIVKYFQYSFDCLFLLFLVVMYF